MKTQRDKLRKAYVEIAAHTLPICKHHCDPPLCCCSQKHCQAAANHAWKYWGKKLVEINEFPHARFLDVNGCTVLPWLRPKCSMFVCGEYGQGKPVKNLGWRRRFYRLLRCVRWLEKRVNGHKWNLPVKGM